MTEVIATSDPNGAVAIGPTTSMGTGLGTTTMSSTPMTTTSYSTPVTGVTGVANPYPTNFAPYPQQGGGINNTGGYEGSAVPALSGHHPVDNQPAKNHFIAPFKTAKGILRITEWWFSLLMFSLMADVPGYSTFSAFQFIVAAGVIAWVYTMAMMAIYIWKGRVEGGFPYMHFLEFFMDLTLTLFMFCGGIAAAARCNSHVGDVYQVGGIRIDGTFKICDSARKKNNIIASVVFTWFNFLAFGVSTFFTFMEVKHSRTA